MALVKELKAEKEDVWIPSVCNICYSNCTIRGRRVDGVLVKIEGHPEAPNAGGGGRICAKGQSGIMLLYDPNRVNYPLKRTNPEKGIGVDPGWQRISWEEALDILASKIKEAREKDPRCITVTFSAVDTLSFAFNASWWMTLNYFTNWWASGAGPHCGNGEHAMAALLHGAIHTQVDYEHCNYLLMFGCGSGAGMYYNATTSMRWIADAKTRGMKVVVFDPLLSTPAERADEWIPIKPGTDGYVALSMMNLLVNEYNLYDAEHLKIHTNAPYLIKKDGKYLRDPDSSKPLVWDPVEAKPKTYDDPSIKDYALTGTYEVKGESCQPAFELFREHLKKYTPEGAEAVSTVPAATIRRITKEFGEAAKIGSTINIEGHQLPYRPVGVLYFKGAQAHKHTLWTAMALSLLPEIVGAADTPGSILGSNPRCLGYPETKLPFWEPVEGPDGLLVAGSWIGPPPSPLSEVKVPENLSLQEISPLCVLATGQPFTLLDPSKYGLKYEPEVLLMLGCNVIMTHTEIPKVAEALKRFSFIACISLHLDEVTEFADLVLPEACYLERYDLPQPPTLAGYHNSAILKEWLVSLRQPMVEPLFERRPRHEIILNLIDRLDLWADFVSAYNMFAQLREPYLLEPNKKYTWTEILDLTLKSHFGEERGLEWFKQNGIIKWKKKPEESYWKHFMKLRVPIYFEWFIDLRERTEEIRRQLPYGEELDFSDLQPLPDWGPCPSHEEKRPEFDLYAYYFRVPTHTFSSTYNNAWLDDLGRIDPVVYNLVINEDYARQRGFKEGDWVWIESMYGGKTKGRLHLTQGIHPECLAIANCGGHWSKHLPLANKPEKGTCFEWLMKLDPKCVDWSVQNWDLCVKVRLTKI